MQASIWHKHFSLSFGTLTEVQSECKVAATAVPLFSHEDDKLLLNEFNTLGRKWKLIEAKVGKHYTAVSVKYRVLLLTACKRIDDCLDAGIEDDGPLKQDDDETTPAELAHHFDLQKALKRMYDPNSVYQVKLRIHKKSIPKKKFFYVFEEKEDEEEFSHRGKNRGNEN